MSYSYIPKNSQSISKTASSSNKRSTSYIPKTSNANTQQSTRDDKDSLRNYSLSSSSKSSSGKSSSGSSYSNSYLNALGQSVDSSKAPSYIPKTSNVNTQQSTRDDKLSRTSSKTSSSNQQSTRNDSQKYRIDPSSSKSKRTELTIAEKKKALEPSKYYVKQTRKDGTTLYYNRSGDLLREVNAKGVMVARVAMGGSGMSLSQGRKIKNVGMEVILEQRMMKKYNVELKKYLREYQKETERIEKLKNLGDYVGKYLLLTGSSSKQKQSIRDDVYRYISPYEIAIIQSMKDADELKNELDSLQTGEPLTIAEQKKLSNIQKRIIKLKAERTKLAASQEKIHDKIVKNLGGDKKNQTWVGRALKELPAAGTNFVWHFAPSLYQAGMELANFVDVATAPKAVRKKLKFKENVINNMKGMIQGFDPRKPENLFNVMLVAGSLASMAKAGVNTTVLNKQLKAAKITKGTSTVTKTVKGADAVIKGNLKLPSVKVLGKTYPGRIVPFETLQKITRQAMNSNAYKIQGSTRYLLKQAAKTIKRGKIKKVFIKKSKTTLYQGEGKINLKTEIKQAINNPKSYAKAWKVAEKVSKKTKLIKRKVSPTTFKQKITVKKKSMIPTKGKTIKTRGVITNKGTISKQSIGLRKQSMIRTNIKQLSESNGVIKFKYTTEFNKLPPKTYASLIKSSSKSISRKLISTAKKLKNPKLTVSQKIILKKQLANLKKNYSTVKGLASSFAEANKELFFGNMGKRGQGSLGIPRGFLKPGSTGAEKYLRAIKQDFSKVDGLLRKIEKLDITKKTGLKTVTKSKVATTQSTQGLRNIAKNFDPSLVFKGYKLLNKPLLVNGLIPLLSLSTRATSSVGLISNLKVKGASLTPSKSPVKTYYKTSIKAPSKSRVKVPAKVVTKPLPSVNPVPALITSPFISNRFFPFAGGLPIPGIGGSGRVLAVPLNRFMRASNNRYSADLYSKLYGIKATTNERTNLLRARRLFSGLEIRKIV